MIVASRTKSSEYHDSATLMLLAKALLDLPGVLDAAVVMGTAANREILAGAGLLDARAEGARPDDLVVVVKANGDEFATAALDEADRRLAQRCRAHLRWAGPPPPLAGFGRRRGARCQPGRDLRRRPICSA